MTKIKSVVVSTRTLARASRGCKLSAFISVGKGVGSGRVLPDGLLADVFEAVIAAIYLDGGFEAARTFVLRHLQEHVARVVRNQHAKNYKSLLQHLAQRSFADTPVYEVVDEAGPDHDKRFKVMAVVCGRAFGPGTGANKKDAEQRAARKALLALRQEAAARDAIDDV